MAFKDEKKKLMERMYPPGTRVELIALCNQERDMPSGLRGTVVGIDDWPQLLMHWDNGRSLSLIPGEAHFKVIQPEEAPCQGQSL